MGYNRQVLSRVLIYTIFVLAGTTPARAETSTVLIFPFENLSDDRNLDWIGEGISALLVEGLRSNKGLTVFTRDERVDRYERLGIPESTMVTRATALKLAWEIGADVVIAGRYSGSADDFEISARLIDVGRMRESSEVKAKGKLENVISLVSDISGQIHRSVSPANASGGQTPEPPSSAFENYIRGTIVSDPQKRKELLQTAVRLYPAYTSAILQLGRVAHLERDFRESNRWFMLVDPKSPDYTESQFFVGLNRFYLGDYAGSAAIYEKLPPNYDVLVNLGAALLEKGDHVGAVLAWRRAIELQPLSSEAYFNIGYSAFLKGDYELALKELIASLKLRGRDSDALFLLGRTHDRLGRYDAAQRLTAEAVRLSQRVERWLVQPLPKLERVRSSSTFRSSSEIWTAARLARRSKAQDLTSWIDLVQTQVDGHQYGDALRELAEIQRAYPNSAESQSLFNEVQKLQRLLSEKLQ